jgi:putative transposase
VDSQRVKPAEIAGERGNDAGEKVKGRKRHVLVDTLGLVRIVVVQAAAIQDRDGAKLVLVHLPGRWTGLARIGADGASAGELIHWDKATGDCGLDIVKRADKLKGCQVLPPRWVVERPCGWLKRSRRLAQDDERLPERSQALIQSAMNRLMRARLARKRQAEQQRQQRQPSCQAGKVEYPLAA